MEDEIFEYLVVTDGSNMDNCRKLDRPASLPILLQLLLWSVGLNLG